MARILYLQSSIFGERGQSSRLAREFIEGYRDRHPDTEVVTRDLIRDGLPHLDRERAAALRGFDTALSEAQKAVLAHSDALIDELQSADLVVIGLPMYNFGVPTQFKTWFDHIARARVTFRYTQSGAVGLLENKPVRVFAAHGGVHLGRPEETTTDFVRHILAFVGLTDVEFIYAEGLNMGEETRQRSLRRARLEIEAQLEALAEPAAA